MSTLWDIYSVHRACFAAREHRVCLCTAASCPFWEGNGRPRLKMELESSFGAVPGF